MAKLADFTDENTNQTEKHAFSPVLDFVLESHLFWRLRQAQRQKSQLSVSANKIEFPGDVLRNGK